MMLSLKIRPFVQSFTAISKLRPAINCHPVVSMSSDYKTYSQKKDEEYLKPPSEDTTSMFSNAPLIKELYLGRFHLEMMTFPEFPKKSDVEELDMMYDQVKKYMLSVDGAKIDREACIPDEVYAGLAELGLFGQQVDPKYGGLGLSASQMSRLWEATALDASIAVTLAAHQSIGLKGILLVGTEAQKEKYLPKLASGEHIAAFCLSEPGSGSDVQSMKTRAVLDESGQNFILNGGKCWISNGIKADIFTVFAQTPVLNDKGEKVDKITGFIVERAFGGVTSTKPEDKLGIRGSNTCEVIFENVKIPKENVLGEVGTGFKLALRILNSGRFTMGAAGAGILRYLLSYGTEHALARHQFGRPIGEFGAIQQKITNACVDIYAMEAMSYLVSGLMDANPQRDLSMEAAAIKVYSSEACWKHASELLQITGGMGFTNSLPFARYLRDARIMLIFEGTNEILRLLISGSSLSYAGKELSEFVRRMRNPYTAALEIASSGLNIFQRKAMKNPPLGVMQMKPKFTSKDFRPISDHVHHMLKTPVEHLNRNILALNTKTSQALSKYGRHISEQQQVMMGLADMSIEVFALAACISRCNRAQSIGLPNADHEMQLTNLFAEQSSIRVNSTTNGLTMRSMDLSKSIASKVLKERGYSASHPLNRVW